MRLGFACLASVLTCCSLGQKIKRGLPSRTICLTFHDIIPVRNQTSLWFDCSVSEFSSELNWLRRKGAHFISTNQLYSHLTKGTKLADHPVCITFADNYLGFYTYAYPLLKRLRIPVAMFVHTGYVGSPIGRPKMDWTQLASLDKEGLVAVESQTVTHPPDLRKLGRPQLDREMTASKAALQSHLHHAVLDLAYPNGKFSRASEDAAKRAGYRMAFSEVLTPAESSPSIFAVARYVHTKFKRAWADANR